MTSLYVRNEDNLLKINDKTKILFLSNDASLRYYANSCFRDKVDKFKKEVRLDLSTRMNINNINNLNLVSVLIMSKSFGLKNMNGTTKEINLWKTRVLNIYNCYHAKNISAMSNLNELNMVNCDEIKDIGNLKKLKKLSITTKIYGLHFLNKLEELNIPNRLKKIMSGELNKLLKINNKLKIVDMIDSRFEEKKSREMYYSNSDLYYDSDAN
jgi:hypothetical protein